MDSTEEFVEPSPDEDEDFLTLRSSTLTTLASFLDEQAAAMDAMVSLHTQSYPPSLAESLQLNGHDCDELLGSQLSGTQTPSDCGPSILDKTMPQPQSQALPVDKFKTVFKENWQLSQFWYTKDTAERLTQAVMKICSIDAHVAFVCCPTGYVAFKENSLPTQEVVLLEYDTRFSIIAGAGFIHYDLDEPLSFPNAEALRESQDIVVVDPPFHSEMSQRKIASTVAHILRPDGRLVILTGLALSPLIDNIYSSPPLPKLIRRTIVIEHDGVGRLETPYGCWVGGGPDGHGEVGFGEPSIDSDP